MKYFTDISLGILAEASEADSIKARISSGDLNRKRREKKRVI